MRMLFLLLAVCSSCFATPIVERSVGKEALSEILGFFGITQENMIAETQKKWLRSSGKERWEMNEISQKEFVLNWAEKSGIYSSWKPESSSYDKALILGATTGVMEGRLRFLVDLWNEGIRFDEIVWLTGERPLDKTIDGLLELATNESEAARVIWKKVDLPKEMRTISVVFVEEPMKGLKRPNTKDTIDAWVGSGVKPCKALVVSSQPFCGYQYGIVDRYLPEEFLFEVVGPGVDSRAHPAAAAITLDSMARWLYVESLPRD